MRPIVGAELPLEEAAEAHRLIESRQSTGKVVLDSMTALVTGAAGGIGRAIVTKLRAEGFDVKELDLVSGFDVTDPEAWEHIGSVDLACLNAGVLTGSDDIAALTDEQYRRAVGVNVDGVVYGVRRLDRVMPRGSTIIVTASLAGLVGDSRRPDLRARRSTPSSASSARSRRSSRRAGSGSRRSVPGWADTALTPPEFKQDLESRGFKLLTAEAVADGVWAAFKSEGTGEAWIVQPGREPLLYEFKGVPGRASGSQWQRAEPASVNEPTAGRKRHA